MELVDQIVELTKPERNSLGFVPRSAYIDAIERQRLIALISTQTELPILAGFVYFSGVKTSAKVQQISTCPSFRRSGVAKALIQALVTELEKKNFLSIQADVASDLPNALAFYKAQGFKIVRQRQGGVTRGRTILIHARFLDTPSLLDFTTNEISTDKHIPLPKAFDVTARTFALDVMVYIDLVKDREFSEVAQNIFKSAFAHEIRIAVADEFCDELKKAGKSFKSDPLYEMALQLPNLSKVNEAQLNELSKEIYKEVFVDNRVKGYGKRNSKSDARHLAHASLAGADAFVTRDQSILNASSNLLSKFNLDVISPTELDAYLPKDLNFPDKDMNADGFSLEDIDLEIAQKYFRDEHQAVNAFPILADKKSSDNNVKCRAILIDGIPRACSVSVLKKHTSPILRTIIHIRPEAIEAELYSEILINDILQSCSQKIVTACQVTNLAGQTIVRANLKERGFTLDKKTNAYEKIVLGRPVLPETWQSMLNETRRRTGLSLPNNFPDFSSSWEGEISSHDGDQTHTIPVSFQQLENLISPSIIATNDRPAVIVSIKKEYSEMLFGDGKQLTLNLTDKKDALLQGQRAYISSDRRSYLFEKDALIFFYESQKNNGAGAIIAVARIKDSIITHDINKQDRQRIVVEDLSNITSSKRVLLTRFDNIFRLNVPVTFKKLNEIGCNDGSNFVTATGTSPEHAIEILKRGGFGNDFK